MPNELRSKMRLRPVSGPASRQGSAGRAPAASLGRTVGMAAIAFGILFVSRGHILDKLGRVVPAVPGLENPMFLFAGILLIIVGIAALSLLPGNPWLRIGFQRLGALMKHILEQSRELEHA
jgi:hypothetical protein